MLSSSQAYSLTLESLLSFQIFGLMMMLLGVKACVTLLWGVSVLFAMETKSTSIPETDSSSSSRNSTAEPNKANSPLATAHVAHSETETQTSVTTVTVHRPADAAVATAAAAETATDASTSPASETEKVAVDTRGGDGSTVLSVTTVTAMTSSLGPQWRHSSAAAATTPAAGDAQAGPDTTMSETVKPTPGQTAATESQQASSSSPVFTTSAAPSASTVVTSPSSPSPFTAANVTAGTPHFIQPSSTFTTTETVAPGTEATSAVHSSSSSPITTKATSAVDSSSSSPITTDATSAVQSSSSASVITNAPSTSPDLPATSQPVSHPTTHTSSPQLPTTTEPRPTSESPTTTMALNDSSTSVASTNTTGILIPRVPKRLPVPTIGSTPAPTAATTHEVTQTPQSTEVTPCSTRGLVKHCLIAIASLGGLATVFMVTTIVLCAKLSVRRYKVKKPQPATEMMCISALLPERNYTSYTRQRNPISNGVLVFPSAADSEEDVGDNLTLSSFLPENDRYV